MIQSLILVLYKGMSGNSTNVGFAAATIGKEKNHKYLTKSSNLGHLFRPLAVEEFGRYGKESVEMLKEASILAGEEELARRNLVIF